MSAIQKTTFAASSLAITVIGAALVTAPLAFARAMPVVADDACSTPSVQLTLSGRVDCQRVNRGVSHATGLTALNRR